MATGTWAPRRSFAGREVTRGALYHHFADKRDLFRAVHEQVEDEIVAAIAARMDGIDDPVELLKAGSAPSSTPAWTRRTHA